jgi:serine/threonine protein phosphatase 1
MGTIMAVVPVATPAGNAVSFLSSLIARFKSSAPNPVFDAVLAPDQALFVIGDIHGCAEQLGQLLEKQPPDSQLVFVGDLIDRGPDSAAVLQIVKDACGAGAVCITGNHEVMMLDFLDRPTERGGRWFKFGGLQTLESLKIGGLGEHSDDAAMLVGRDNLEACLGPEMIGWLRALPTQWHSGNVHVVHASADPKMPMNTQERRVLIWGHPDFATTNRSDGQWVVYGHTIHEQPNAQHGRIAVDTGAFATGRLTAAHITTDNVAFIQT